MTATVASNTTEPIALGTYKTAVYERLLDLIMELELPPGTRLVEKDLSARYGVSKTPVREALLLLHTDALVTLIPHTGATVTWLSVEEYDQQVALLDAIEQPFLRQVADRIDEAQAARLLALVGLLRSARSDRDGRRYRDLLVEIHDQTFAVVGSPHLSRMIGWLFRQSRRYGCAFTQRFDDTWDLELSLVTDRIAHVCGRDAGRAAQAVQSGHRKLNALIHSRATHPDVSRYLRSAAPQPLPTPGQTKPKAQKRERLATTV